MKLRNRKTRIVGELRYEPDKEYHFTVETEDPFNMAIYRTLAELNAKWEDYKPKEPLIKDEKIRKVVRAWYDLNTNKDFAVFCEDACTLSIAHSARIEFLEKVFDNIKRDYGYPIAELCGEEE